MEGRENGKRKAAHGGAALALFIHFQKLCKDNNGESDDTESNQHFLTPQTNVNRFAVVVLVNLSAMAGAFFFNAVVSIRELVTVL